MDKSSKSPKPTPDTKGFLELAGEALHVLGHDIAEGKDKVVEVASEKITVFKKAVGKIIHKKKAATPSKKAASKKSAPAKKKATAKKKAPAKKKTAVTKKITKKAASAPKKAAPKKAAPKKAVAKKKAAPKKAKR